METWPDQILPVELVLKFGQMSFHCNRTAQAQHLPTEFDYIVNLRQVHLTLFLMNLKCV